MAKGFSHLRTRRPAAVRLALVAEAGSVTLSGIAQSESVDVGNDRLSPRIRLSAGTGLSCFLFRPLSPAVWAQRRDGDRERRGVQLRTYCVSQLARGCFDFCRWPAFRTHVSANNIPAVRRDRARALWLRDLHGRMGRILARRHSALVPLARSELEIKWAGSARALPAVAISTKNKHLLPSFDANPRIHGGSSVFRGTPPGKPIRL